MMTTEEALAHPTAWIDRHDALVILGYFAVENGIIRDLYELLYFFEKPWKYTEVWMAYNKTWSNQIKVHRKAS